MSSRSVVIDCAPNTPLSAQKPLALRSRLNGYRRDTSLSRKLYGESASASSKADCQSRPRLSLSMSDGE
jgi:hypothetical protein